MRGDLSREKALLRSEADPNLLLCTAAEDGQLNTVQYLLTRGADGNEPLADGNTTIRAAKLLIALVDRMVVPRANKLNIAFVCSSLSWICALTIRTQVITFLTT
jgi:hypothetical protein